MFKRPVTCSNPTNPSLLSVKPVNIPVQIIFTVPLVRLSCQFVEIIDHKLYIYIKKSINSSVMWRHLLRYCACAFMPIECLPNCVLYVKPVISVWYHGKGTLEMGFLLVCVCMFIVVFGLWPAVRVAISQPSHKKSTLKLSLYHCTELIQYCYARVFPRYISSGLCLESIVIPWYFLQAS